jgi:methyl-accepting chemotaxis protein
VVNESIELVLLPDKQAQWVSVDIGQVQEILGEIQQATGQALASTRQAERAAQDLHALAQSLQQTIASYRL